MENVGDEQLEAVSGGAGCIGGTMKCPGCGSKDIKATEYKLTGGRYRVLLSTFFVRFYAISGVCTQKCASCDCINFLVIMKVSHPRHS